MKVETIKNLQDSLESLKKHSGFDLEKLRKESEDLREELRQKDSQLQTFAYQCNDLMQAALIEVPLTFLKSYKQNKIIRGKSVNKNQPVNGNNNKLKFIKEINEEVQMMMDAAEEENEELFKIPMSLQNTLKKNKKRTKKPQQVSVNQ